jgi:hypothetical protein
MARLRTTAPRVHVRASTARIPWPKGYQKGGNRIKDRSGKRRKRTVIGGMCARPARKRCGAEETKGLKTIKNVKLMRLKSDMRLLIPFTFLKDIRFSLYVYRYKRAVYIYD